MIHFTIILSLLAFALCGCSVATRPPTKFSQQLSAADRLVVTNRYFSFGEIITGADVSSVTAAIKAARKKTWGANMDWSSDRVWDMEIDAGTNRLAVIPVCWGVFRLDGIEYNDGSGVLEAFWNKLEADRTR